MTDLLHHILAEACCEHVVRVAPGQSTASAVVRHGTALKTVRLASVSTSRQERELRLALLDWLCFIHERSEVA